MVKIGDIELGSFPLLLAPMEDEATLHLERYAKKMEQMSFIQSLFHQKD